MHLTPLVAVSAASCTWIGFAACMKYYFRYAGQVTRAKTWLVASGFVVTLTQIAVLALANRPSPLLGWTGIVCYLFTNGLFWWSLVAHGKKHPAFAFVPVSPESFTRSGPYRFIRHPIYSSYLLAWIGGAVFAGQAWLLIPVAWMWYLYNRAAQQEEQSFLASSFALEYQKYQKRTGRFLPKLGLMTNNE